VKFRFAAALLVAAVFAGTAPARANLLTPEDERLYKLAFSAAHNDDYSAARNTAARAHDKLLGKVLTWMYFVAPNSGAVFADITDFIRANPTWPQSATLMRRAEEAITAATPDQAVRDWFDVYPPLTVDGAMAYAKALQTGGQTDKAAKVARDAWVSGNFGPIQERQFLANFQDLLRDEDQVARLDRLLWEHQESAVEHQILRADGEYRLVAQARMALFHDASNAEAVAARVPEKFKNDPGLIYELLRYRRAHDMDDEAMALLSHPSRNKVHPEMWWTERAVMARKQLQQGHITQAYQIARDHGQTEGAGYADAEWLAGWIALRFLDDREVALQHFARMYERVNTPQSRARAAYWAGRACDVLGRGDDSVRWYAAAAQNVTTFYGQLAASRISPEQQWPMPADPLPNAADIDFFEKHELVRVARMLGEIKESEMIRPFMLRMNELAKTPGQRALAANLATNLGRSDIAVAVAKKSEREGFPLIASGYPIPQLGQNDQPEKALVLGLIRQESAFHFEAVSPVGARGLMQLMPDTASRVAKGLGLKFKKQKVLDAALTSDPSLNVKLGSAYLGGLLDNFNGSYILSIASYNAGPGRIRRWMKDNGDPRTPDVDAIDWIESIPYSETRNYVQRVLEGVQIYRRRLGATGLAHSLENDLKR
jgi:soluble lytic murein transglycosylase